MENQQKTPASFANLGELDFDISLDKLSLDELRRILCHIEPKRAAAFHALNELETKTIIALQHSDTCKLRDAMYAVGITDAHPAFSLWVEKPTKAKPAAKPDTPKLSKAKPAASASPSPAPASAATKPAKAAKPKKTQGALPV